MLGQGHTLRLPDEALEVEHHQRPGPENQDSQHMIDQLRGSFPDENKGFAPRTPENDENDENGRCHSGKGMV